MNNSITTLLDNTHPGQPSTFKGLTLIPLFAPTSTEPSCISLTRALKEEGFRITEVSAGGSVPELLVINPTPFNVFLFDGQELKGAKQNRVLNTSILVPARSELKIPVSCTESGRWSSISPEFSDSETVMSSKIRRSKSASVTASYMQCSVAMSNQSEVWGEIEDLHACAETSGSSATRAMKDAYDAHRKSLEEFKEAFPCEENQSGLLAIRQGRIEGADLISQPTVYRDLHESLVQSYALDALVRPPTPDREGEDPEAPTSERSEAFLAQARHCDESTHQSVGMGEDHRLSGEQVNGSALVVDETSVHLALFSIDPDRPEQAMPGASLRRRNRWPYPPAGRSDDLCQ